MTQSGDTRMDHPEELLAGYVDDSVSPEERRTVEAHLADCSQCRNEVALATSARAALMRLPELEAPGLAAQGLSGLREGTTDNIAPANDELAARREAKREDARGLRQWRISWAALAGAAAVVAVLAVVPLVLSRGGGDTQTAGSALRPEASRAPAGVAERYPPVFDLGSDYDQESMRALARRLGSKARSAAGSEDTATDFFGPLSAGSARVADVPATDAVQCVLQGTGLPPETVPVYLEVAEYQGTPAYVAAVLTRGSGRDHLRVYIVSREGCMFLFLADQPL